MIQMPDFSKAMEYENNFWLACDTSRMAKVLAHYELFKLTAQLPGAIVECGVFKGVSLKRFAMLRELFQGGQTRKIIGFDIFGKFPETCFALDRTLRENFIKVAGEESIDKQQLTAVLEEKQMDKQIELIAGDINQTVPQYVEQHPELKIALLNLDTDIYEPAVTILEHLYPRIVSGGILLLDDYGVFPGETKAVDDYFKGRDVIIRRMPFALTPSYIIKQE